MMRMKKLISGYASPAPTAAWARWATCASRPLQGTVPISNFVTRTPAQAVGNIERTDLRRTLKISADLAPGYLVKDTVAKITARP